MADQPFFSVVMASYLGEYSGNYGTCAKDRLVKFDRAVNSVIDQQFLNWELIVVSDGCERTWEQRELWMNRDKRIRFMQIPKQKLWSGKVRNAGIYKSFGRYIIYLDTDDRFGFRHLGNIHKGIVAAGMPRIVVFNDWIWNVSAGLWSEKLVAPDRRNGIGTSNIAHDRELGAYWPEIVYTYPQQGYDHDMQFWNVLKSMDKNHVRVEGSEYYVCHIPRHYDI